MRQRSGRRPPPAGDFASGFSRTFMRPLREIFPHSFGVTFFLFPSWVHAIPLKEEVSMPFIFTLIAFVATLIFAILSCAFFMRIRKNIESERDTLAKELSDMRMRSEQFETLVQADDQRFLIWNSGQDKPIILGDLCKECAAPSDPSNFIAFGKWLSPASAATLEREIDSLRQDGQSFQAAITTKQNHYIDVYGRTVAGRVVVRFRDLSGDQQIMLAQRAKIEEKTGDISTYQALLSQIDQPVWLRHKQEEGDEIIHWANDAYLKAVESGNDDGPGELLDSDARHEMKVAHGDKQLFKKRVAAVANGARCTFDVVSVPTDIGSAGMATDVSEAEKAQSALSRTVKSHEMTLDELTTAVVIFDNHHTLTFFNKAYRDLFELDEGFLASKPSDSEVLDKLRSMEKLPVEANFRQWKNSLLKVHQSMTSEEFTWHLPDGQTLRVVASPRDSGGVTWFYENLTQRLDLESRVNVLSRLQGETLNRLSDGVGVFSSNGQLTLMNQSFLDLWELEDETSVQLQVNELAEFCSEKQGCLDDWHRLKMAIVGVSEGREQAHGEMERNDGSVLRYSTNALIDGRTLLTFEDVTDSVNVERALKEKNEALSEADKLKTDFVKHVNYELRSPLTNIIGFAQLLSDDDIGPLTTKQQEYTDYILSSSSALLAIINDILDLATADAGVMELSLGKVSVSAIIDSAVEGLQDRILEKKLNLVIDVQSGVDAFVADERRMVQVLFNMLSNAIHFSQDGHKIELTVASDKDQLTFKVQDWGAGIPPAFIDQVFNRFESRSVGGTKGGVGLGLSIVKRFIELHDGDVRVESKEGEGTTVICSMPSSPRPEEIAAE